MTQDQGHDNRDNCPTLKGRETRNIASGIGQPDLGPADWANETSETHSYFLCMENPGGQWDQEIQMSRDEFIALKQTLAAMRRGKQEVAPDFVFSSPTEMPAGSREIAYRKRLVEKINWNINHPARMQTAAFAFLGGMLETFCTNSSDGTLDELIGAFQIEIEDRIGGAQ